MFRTRTAPCAVLLCLAAGAISAGCADPVALEYIQVRNVEIDEFSFRCDVELDDPLDSYLTHYKVHRQGRDVRISLFAEPPEKDDPGEDAFNELVIPIRPTEENVMLSDGYTERRLFSRITR